ncbi:Rab3 GTPase-activating protein catalytic subunit [Blyttiomyces sp. JEL0837]|nr:Rab3 GTPase-activating protein catalytic subunit [Blyttiomyces sp. JEL0837]
MSEDEDDEVFEILDFTAISPWERFISTIEGVLSSWGLENGELGIFDPRAVLEHGGNFVGSKKEVVMFGDQSYVLSYHCALIDSDDKTLGNAGVWNNSSNRQKSSSDSFESFLSTSVSDVNGHRDFISIVDRHSPGAEEPDSLVGRHAETTRAAHPLHRWSGYTHLLTVTPFSISDIFDGAEGRNIGMSAGANMGRQGNAMTVDPSTNKFLISSLAMAFQNISCMVPIFVPVGPPWKSTFSGFSLCGRVENGFSYRLTSSGDLTDRALASYGLAQAGVEFRYRMTFLPYVPIAQSHVDGLAALFRSKLSLKSSSQPNELSDWGQQISVSSVLTYEYYTENKGRWFEKKMFFKHYDEKRRTEPLLPLGMAFDPLVMLTLECFFPQRRVVNVVDNLERTDFMAPNSQIWNLSVTKHFAQQDMPRLPMMTTIIKSIWLELKDADATGGTSRFDADAEDDTHREDSDRQNSHVPKAGLMSRVDSAEIRAREALGLGRKVVTSAVLRAVGAAENIETAAGAGNGIVGLVDTQEICDAVAGLFSSLPSSPSDSTSSERVKDIMSFSTPEWHPPTVDQVIARLRHSPIVPVRSFFWNLTTRIMDSMSPVTSLRFRPALIAFVKALWAEILIEIRRLWDYGIAIPHIDIESASRRGHLGIDLRWSLLHQKLCMLNLCIQRKAAKAGTSPHTSPLRVEPNDNDASASPSNGRVEKIISPLTFNDHGMPTAEDLFAKTPLSTTRNQPQTISAISSRFIATLTDIASEVVGVNESRATDFESRNTSAFPSRQTKGLPANVLSSPSHSGDNHLFGTSWNSDRSWEDFSSSSLPRVVNLSDPRKTRLDASPGVSAGSDTGSDVLLDLTREDLETERERASGRNGAGDESIHSGDIFFDTHDGSLGQEQGGRQLLQDDFKESLQLSMDLPVQQKSEETPTSFAYRKSGMNGRSDSYIQLVSSEQDKGNIGATALLEDIERVIQKGGSTAGNFGDSDDWAAVEVKGEDVSEGGVEVLAGVKLIKADRDMVIPEVQNPGYMTEDMIEEQEKIFERLGTSEEAAHIRARMQCAQLKSDLQTARRIPASRQKPLFDYEKEAEKVLFFLENLPSDQVLKRLFPVALLQAYEAISCHPVSHRVASIAARVSQLATKLVHLFGPHFEIDSDQTLSVIEDLKRIECSISLADSLLSKLPLQYRLVDTLVSQGFSVVKDQTERETVLDLFLDERQRLVHPNSREFIFTASAPHPTITSRTLPQRMYVLLKQGEFRSMETVASDTLQF